MSWTRIGGIEIGRVVEQEGPVYPARTTLPDLAEEVLADARGWMVPGAMDANDDLVFCFQSFVVRTPDQLLLVDSCIGNGKDRPGRGKWHRKSDTRFMDGLAALGVHPEEIDAVLCTHLHVDHVGWNTRLVDGRWVPTFPNARYVFGADEYAYWEARERKVPNPVYQDSVLPIVEARRAELVASDHALGDHVRLLPTPGHTPGHVAVLLGRDDAVVSGDLLHSPLQARYPELSSSFDVDRALAAKTRRAFLERFCDTRTVCCMSHFPSPSLGRVGRWEGGFRCDPL